MGQTDLFKVTHMLGLYYLPTPRSRKYRLAYRMHLAGFENMRADMLNRVEMGTWSAETGKWYLAKIIEEKV